MSERLESDLERLLEAVAIFRVYSDLHGNSPDASIIQFAHRGGKRFPQSSTVREAWIDYVQDRRYMNLETVPYMIVKDGGSARVGGSGPKRGAQKSRTPSGPPSTRTKRSPESAPPEDDDSEILF